MGMHNGPRSFSKNLPKIAEDDEDLKVQNFSSSGAELLDLNSQSEDDLLQSSGLVQKDEKGSSEKKKPVNLDFIFKEEFRSVIEKQVSKTLESQLEGDIQSQGSFFLSESEIDDAISNSILQKS